MCEFCLKHGEGKKWYLEAKNYSEDLLSDVRRRQMITEFFEHPELASQFIEKTERLQTLPKFVREWFIYLITRKQKKIHYGQVVPIEDVEKIFNLTNSIVRIACYCRYSTLGKEKRYCYGISLSPESNFAEIMAGLDSSFLTGQARRAWRNSRERKRWKHSASMNEKGCATPSGRSAHPSSAVSAIVTALTVGPCASPCRSVYP